MVVFKSEKNKDDFEIFFDVKITLWISCIFMCPPCIAKVWPSLYDKHTYIILAMNKAEDVLGHHVFQKYPRLYSYDFWVCKPAATCMISFSHCSFQWLYWGNVEFWGGRIVRGSEVQNLLNGKARRKELLPNSEEWWEHWPMYLTQNYYIHKWKPTFSIYILLL